MRVVIDTSVFISAYVLGEELGIIIRSLIDRRFTLILSAALLEEYLAVLRRSKFMIRHEEAGSLIGSFDAFKEDSFIIGKALPLHVPESSHALRAAINGDADYLVSDDIQLLKLKRFRTDPELKLKKFRSVPIITSSEFIDLLTED